MPCSEANVVSFCNHTNDSAYEYCNPHLRENFRNVTPAEANDENCMKNRFACGDCCYPLGKECFATSPSLEHSKNFKETGQGKYLHSLAHSCPVGKIICCTDCDCKNDKDIIKAEDISETRGRIMCNAVRRQEPISEDPALTKYMSCCAKEKSLTKPRSLRCDPCDPSGCLKGCGCDCGAAIFNETTKEKPKKSK